MWSIYTVRFLFLVLFVSSLQKISDALRCYQCGSEAIFMDYDEFAKRPPKEDIERREDIMIKLESCTNLEYYSFSSWSLTTVDCGPNQVCAKIVIDTSDENGKHRYVTASRGCAMRNDSSGNVHSLKCGVLRSKISPPTPTDVKWDLSCFCNTDYCNEAILAKDSFWLIVVASCVSLFKEYFVN